ncbi:MAG TPA: hypothetical protein VKE94_06900 [Gemmataceae bacterium]|nr:hypothetical protein [Gemmataceae bacterium]
MMPPYPIYCYTKGCGKLAVYKIAARWSDGITAELKTYALTCPDCLAACFRSSRARHAACRRARGEILEPPGIYDMERGKRDRVLHRRPDLEQRFV